MSIGGVPQDGVASADRAGRQFSPPRIAQLRVGERVVANDKGAPVPVRVVEAGGVQQVTVEEQNCARRHLAVNAFKAGFDKRHSVFIRAGLFADLTM